MFLKRLFKLIWIRRYKCFELSENPSVCLECIGSSLLIDAGSSRGSSSMYVQRSTIVLLYADSLLPSCYYYYYFQFFFRSEAFPGFRQMFPVLPPGPIDRQRYSCVTSILPSMFG